MKSHNNLADAHIIQSISVLFGHDERLIEFFFHHKYPGPRLSSRELLNEAQDLRSCEWILMKVSLDFWDGSGGTTFNELIRILDEEQLTAVIRAILHFREISMERCNGGEGC